MAYIIVPSRRIWTRQPQSEVLLSDLGRDALFVYNPAAGPINLANGNPLTKLGSLTPSITPLGRAINGTYGSEAGLRVLSENLTVRNMPGVTVVAMVQMQSQANQTYPGLVSNVPSGELYGGWNLTGEVSSEGAQRFVFWRAGDSANGLTMSGSYGSAPASHEWDVGDIITLVGTFDRPSGLLSLGSHIHNKPGYGYKLVSRAAHASTWRNAVSLSQINTYFRSTHRSSPHKLSLTYALPYASEEQQIGSLLENPWQIFRPRRQVTFFDLGAGGVSAVNNDNSAAYLIRAAAQSDSAAEYLIRSLAAADTSPAYNIRAAVAAESSVSYAVAGSVAASNSPSYNIHAAVAADAAAAYAIRAAVQADQIAEYAVREAVSADLASAYDIQTAGAVASSSTAEYAIRGAVSSDLPAAYNLHAAVAADVEALYALRAAVSADSVAAYDIKTGVSAVYSDLVASYNIDGGVVSGLTAEQIATAVIAALRAANPPVPVDAPTATEVATAVWSHPLP